MAFSYRWICIENEMIFGNSWMVLVVKFEGEFAIYLDF